MPWNAHCSISTQNILTFYPPPSPFIYHLAITLVVSVFVFIPTVSRNRWYDLGTRGHAGWVFSFVVSGCFLAWCRLSSVTNPRRVSWRVSRASFPAFFLRGLCIRESWRVSARRIRGRICSSPEHRTLATTPRVRVSSLALTENTWPALVTIGNVQSHRGNGKLEVRI